MQGENFSDMDILLKNGNIVDGTGSPAYKADLYIKGERIEMIDPSSKKNLAAGKTIDLSGKTVCPGFIDVHTHSDLKLLHEPLAEGKARQGVTTEFLGLDGVSYAPADKKSFEFFVKYFGPINGDFKIDLKWNDLGEFISMFNGKASVNVGCFLPHGNLRMVCMKNVERKAFQSEISTMLECVRIGMAEGALGLSTGLAYYPCFYGELEELTTLCSEVRKNNGIFVTHMRKNKDPLISLEETIEIGRRSGVSVHISHFRPTCKQEEQYDLLNRAKDEGIDISYDCYPYNAACSALWIILPYWFLRRNPEEMLRLLKEPETRKKLRNDMSSLDWNKVKIASVSTERNSFCEGKSIHDASMERKLDPLDFFCELLIDEDLNALGIIYSGNEKDVEAAIKNPMGMFCSDGIITGKKTHPRGYGSFARILRKYVREKKMLSMEEAVRKMTSYPAKRFQVKKRGELKTGFYADIAAFDAESVRDANSYASPYIPAEGFEVVINNGQIIFEKGQMTGKMPGKAILKKQK
jgi:N-acyl-D-amino-acid deacylase